MLESDIWQVYKDRGVVVWGVNVSPGSDDIEKIRDFKEEYKLTFPLALDVNRETHPYSSGGIPTLYIIDRDGVIRFGDVGFHGSEPLIAKIEELLDEEPVGPTFDLRLNKMDATPYVAGETMTLYADVTNPGDALAVNIFIAVELYGEFYFWPTYTTMMTPTGFLLPDELVMLGYELESVTFNDTFYRGSFAWYGVLANPLDGEWITEPSIVQWSFGSGTP